MIIYSETIFAFIEKCEQYIKDIINHETPYSRLKRRVLVINKYYPVSVVVFLEKAQLGYYCPQSYQIGLNEKLIYNIKEHTLKDILRHELAHFFCDVLYGEDTSAHGENFLKVCQNFKWDKNISKASLDIEKSLTHKSGQLDSERIITQVKNLLELAKSDNEHEASLATAKANALLLKHNLEKASLDQDYFYVDLIYKSKKNNSKVASFYQILQHFLVCPLILYRRDGVYLEVTGDKENIELARYLIEYLDREFEALWKTKHNLKGLRAKNSFFEGLALGFCEKLENQSSNFGLDDQKALIKINQDLKEKQQRVHRRLSRSSSARKSDKEAMYSGRKAGHKLKVNLPLKNKKSKLLSWRKNA